jgi:outer membrane immunogenic protein
MCGATALAVAKPYKPVPPPPPPPVQSWTGFYVGGNAGYDWSQQTTNYAPNAFIAGLQNGGIPGSLTQNLRGFTGGVQGGYNYQIGQELVGIEADFSGLTMNGTTASNLPGCFAPPGPGPCPALPSTTTLSQNNKLNWLSTLRGRLGLLSAPDLLLYATGGLAVGRVQAQSTLAANVGLGPCVTTAFECSAGSVSSTRTGWTIGGGTEYALGQRWTIKAEYLYFDLGTVSYGVLGALGSQLQANAKFTGQIARAGVNYHF